MKGFLVPGILTDVINYDSCIFAERDRAADVETVSINAVLMAVGEGLGGDEGYDGKIPELNWS